MSKELYEKIKIPLIPNLNKSKIISVMMNKQYIYYLNREEQGKAWWREHLSKSRLLIMF